MDDLASRLKAGPALLFLGQDYLKLENSVDTFLGQILDKYGQGHEDISDYSSIFNTNASLNPAESIAWMYNRCRYIPAPEPLQVIAQFAWSSVFTSAIDSIIDQAFRATWREIQIVSSPDYIPHDPRNSSRLHIWHLCGSVAAAPETDGYPPLRLEDSWQRQTVSTLMSTKIPEILTQIGTMLIEGYSCKGTDWITPQQLYSIINSLLPNQVHIFSYNFDHNEPPELKALRENGKLQCHPESLAQWFLNSSEIGAIKLGESPEEFELGHQILINGTPVTIPKELWIDIKNIARIPVRSVYLRPVENKSSQDYSDFRNFLYESSCCPIWDGYARNFAFNRDFEDKLKERVIKGLNSDRMRSQPLIIRGQTGIGKTVALGNLAYKIQKEGTYPVIFIERAVRNVRRDSIIIDKFCEWAEEKGAKSTLIIWDGMRDPYGYVELLNLLRSRGRKALLLGSCYLIRDEAFSTNNMIDVQAELTENEKKNFPKYISRFDPALAKKLTVNPQLFSDRFLVFLYRMLPPSRTAIRDGIENEVYFTERYISNLVKKRNIQQGEDSNTILADALFKAGIIKENPILKDETIDISNEYMTELNVLFGLVMVPGQFNISCPFELLMRSIGKRSVQSFVNILKQVDIFQWVQDSSGTISIGPRSALEAQIIVKQRIGGAKYEVEFVRKLLSNIDRSTLFQNAEIQFAVELVQNIGPNGRNPIFYDDYLRDISDALKELREIRGITNPRLMLQEIMFLREYAKKQDNNKEKRVVLLEAEAVSKQALSIIEDKSANRQLRSSILVDLAATYGQLSNNEATPSERLNYAQMSHTLCLEAFSLDSQNHYPIDVISWTSRDLLKDNVLTEDERLEIIKTVFHAFNIAETEHFYGSILARIEQRKLQIAEVIKDTELSNKAFAKLLDQGSASGIFFRASLQVTFLYDKSMFSEKEQMACKETYDYMLSFGDIVFSDLQCLYLLFRVWWVWKTGTLLFYGERICLPFTHDDWFECRKMVTRLQAHDEIKNNLRMRYIEAVACIHLKDHQSAMQIFSDLDRESLSFNKRVSRWYLLSDENGTPMQFEGTIVNINERGQGSLHVNEFQRNIPFLVHEAKKADPQKGDNLTFKVAFNMRGLIADFRE
ncbi:P-loop NTPase [Desulfosudis oleivorans]|uniref:Novel STAND NTPase 5 domain-containing protein n=1 Tax=Desulfosudis oleivorans (strain DSM 6200 / JCM 39069 / Hxd3) TaxID=96561 RepID=A8ZZL7_DESOH|nr:hypothetical protein [Desulfosudis oleivorans]ABW68889.1 hypothetical protein Dole_3086 [Desulfosudis oleivorans Hxd3]